MFVVFEGIDKSGKTTLCKAVYNRLQTDNIACEMIHFPIRTSYIGQILNNYLVGKIKMDPYSQHLLFTADRYNFMLNKKFDDKCIYLIDRYSWSGITATVSKGVDLDWCILTEDKLPKPDLTIFLDCDVELCAKRHGWGDEVLENVETQIKIRDVFKQMENYVDNVITLDTSQNQNVICDKVFKEIKNLICGVNKRLEN
ncbi:thymidylate kinase [Vairimorpha apis BRL 01]|uniref:dTMP kinase n=2 Tax=Vairimorpha apis BRL 01 TaxID=1037528 RepID=T0L6A5_9MICR|nr:thymidylate kinase [Vairimorpha apis BRL 01]